MQYSPSSQKYIIFLSDTSDFLGQTPAAYQGSLQVLDFVIVLNKFGAKKVVVILTFLAILLFRPGKGRMKRNQMTLEGGLSALPSLPVDILNIGASPGKIITC